MNGWYLEQISIEGFRGINNKGAPLVLNLKPECVNSISAPNGVGKSSIFEAIGFAITGEIPKLDALPAAEKGQSYYLNRFHGGGLGTIKLQLAPALGGAPITVTVTRSANGARSVSADGGANGQEILDQLNREFVLLDGKTFHDFMEDKPLDRGRSLAGLLGLRRYSALRQALGSLSNTRAFNNFFDVTGKQAEKAAGVTAAGNAQANIQDAYKALVGEEYDPAIKEADLLAQAHSALHGIELLKPHCEGKSFEQIDPGACVDAAKAAEGGEDREKLAQVLRDEVAWTEAVNAAPEIQSRTRLIELADERDAAVAITQGDTFRQLYGLGEQVLSSDAWPDKNLCPVCDRTGDDSVLDHVRAKIGDFEAVGNTSSDIATEWSSKGWTELSKLEDLATAAGETKLFAQLKNNAALGVSTGEMARTLVSWVGTLLERADHKMKALSESRQALEKALPPKLTEVVEKAEAARRLQSNLTDLAAARTKSTDADRDLARIGKIKEYLDQACQTFGEAESRASSRRLKAVEPKAREFFAAIMFEDVVPSITKRQGGEEIGVSLAEFWTLEHVSAQALLSESYRNAFAISVYLAAASLYAGGAHFLVLDDVTSSFDSGHQFHLMNVIRDKFGRPGVTNGPQVIVLSHDTVLEKLFNTNANGGGWWHQCIQGTPRTAVLPQSGAVSKIRDATLSFLNAGNTDDAAPRIRQYLEFKLEEVITRVGIPVPITIAYNDDKHMAQNLLDAINRGVNLHVAANKISLEASQRAGLNTAVATIVGNYLTHWSTGQSHLFTAAALKGVVSAIDAFARCFQFEDPVGSGNYLYYKSLANKT